MRPKPTGEPCVVQETDAGDLICEGLSPLPLKDGVTEEWLQRVLDKAPGLLPVQDIDERVQPPLFSLGREVPTPAGPIDNLFISTSGHLIVVETKLWRNPESRREVVAQILDYAKHVRKWTYSKLRTIIEERLWAAVEPLKAQEQDWIDQVNDNLAKGRMALLIVGDGIRTETEALVDLVSGEPGFPFRLALVELRIYQHGTARWLVVPSITAKTMEIERAVVRIEPALLKGVTVETPVAAGDGHRKVLSEQQFKDHLRT